MLLCEGQEDIYVVSASYEYLGHAVPPFAKNCTSIDELKKLLPIELRSSTVTELGILVDCNASMQARYDSIRTILMTVDSTAVIPKKYDPTLNWLQVNNKRVAIYMFGNSKDQGYVESALLECIDPLDPRLLGTKAFIDNALKNYNPFRTIDYDKVLLNSFVTIFSNPLGNYNAAFGSLIDLSKPKGSEIISWFDGFLNT